MKFIAKLFPEIAVKSRPVRKRLIARLQNNLNVMLRRIDEGIKVSGHWDKVEVSCDGDDAQLREQIVDLMGRTPGIQYFIEVQEFPLGDFDNAFQLTRQFYAEALKGKTFKVRVKRSGKHEFTSIDLERYVGGGLRQHTEAKGVDVHKPDLYVDLEVRNDKLYIITDRHPGQGGYPLGSQDAVVSLISGGFDSIVASYMTMRRGCKTHFLFFNLGGKAHEIGVKQVALYLWQKYGSSARVKFITVPFEEVVGEILQSVHHSHMGVVLKRMMMRAGEKVAERIGAHALVTGESVAQVSSQTLPNLALIDAATETLVLRPLVTMDKQDIIDKATEIGTYDFAKSMPEFCGVISDRPTTHAKRDRLEQEEEGFDFEVLQRALEQTQVISIDEIVEDVNVNAQVEALTKVAANQVIVDVRHPHEAERKPLNLPGCEVLTIPFFKLDSEFAGLDPTKEYLLYCEKGVMSQMHAQQLQDKGHLNVKVYRPDGDGKA
ncbi:tRNA uracil 4-sulfurtransferase ThiI [Marinobacterium arenosum]|uniref:tRNA uracil 4-sulfurtransferase ThiI n=1 Tax=Marinobacterium arenosum TaxID=2862496 RepID=UPI001C96402D|nr:tRNA uracil 4-sulfurtransferase ThiI [Marinobacterium arenosum]MBY4675676.1 tRNA 4-thiouridine(8) synthase ThiI [Marinobacterium arenosum]